MVTEHRLSRVKACKLAGVSRAALYRERADWAKRDTPVVQALNEVVEHHGRWGFWKCFHRLRDQGHMWNHKKVHRVYCSMKLNLPRRAKKRVFTRERVPLLAPTAINQMWALDFMHDMLYYGRKFRLLNLIDEENREALRIKCSSSFPARLLFRVMDVTCPDIFEQVGFRDNGSSHLRSSDEASKIYGRADRSNIARGG